MLENLREGKKERKLADELHQQVIDKSKEIGGIRKKIKELQKKRAVITSKQKTII